MKQRAFKSIIATTLAGIMLFGSVPAATLAGINLPALDFASVRASAQGTEYTDTALGLKYVIDNGVTITGYTDNLAVDAQGAFSIPEKVADGTYSVTAIGKNAFKGCGKIKTLTIPANIKQIGESAFQECSGLTAVYFNANACTMPDTSYDNDYFERSAFRFCGELTKAVFGSNVTAIPDYVMHGVSSLNTVEFKGKVTEIGNYSFMSCTGIGTVDLTNVKKIGEYAFRGCTSLTSPEFSNGLTSIGKYAFNGCIGINEINLTPRITTIGEFAFKGCSAVKELTVPSNVTSIGNGAFQNCAALTELTFNAASCAMPNSSYENDYYKRSAFKNCGSLEKVTFGSNVTEIPAYALHGVTSVEEIHFKAKVTKIGDMAFRGCTGVFDIYYAGAKTDWNKMAVGSNNEIITNAIDYEQFDGTYSNAWIHFSTAPAVTEYTLTYNANGGSGAPSAVKGKGGITLSANSPVRNGYAFRGWALSSGASTAQYQPGEAFTLTNDTVLYAVWEKEAPAAAEYTVYYNANGGIGAPASQTGSGTVTLSGFKPSRNGYVFKGWSSDPYAAVASYQPGDTFNLVANTTLYAVWGIAKPVFHMRSSATVDYRTNVTLTATADNVQRGYRLAIFEGRNMLEAGDNKSVSCNLGEMTGNRTLNVKVIDAEGNIQTDENGTEYSATCEIRVSSSFFARIISFFRGMFGTAPSKTI